MNEKLTSQVRSEGAHFDKPHPCSSISPKTLQLSNLMHTRFFPFFLILLANLLAQTSTGFAQTITITGPSPLCTGTAPVTYSVPIQSGAASYVWIISSASSNSETYIEGGKDSINSANQPIKIIRGPVLNSIQIVPGMVGGQFSLSANVRLENGTTRNAFRTVIMPYAEAGETKELSCTTPSVTIGNTAFQQSVTYRWTGPNGFTSTVKNPTVSVPGTYVITVAGSGGACSSTDEVVVSAPSENCPPSLTTITNKTLNELTNLPSTILTASDPNNDPITFSFRHAIGDGEMTNGLPAGAAFNEANRLLTWRPSEEQGPGIFNIEVTVSDGELTDTKSFTITVNEVNTAPVYSPISNAYGIVGQNIEFPVSAVDNDIPGTPTITLSLGGDNGIVPAGATITNTPPSANPQTGLFSWTPTASQVGRIALYGLANDGNRGGSSNTFYVYVNAAPNLNPISAKTVEAGKQLTFQLSGTDVNSSSNMFTSPAQTRSFSAVVSPIAVEGEYPSDDVPAITKIAGDWTGNQNITGANTSVITGIFSWYPTTPGTYTVTVRLQDSGIAGNFPLADEESFTVTVTAPPVVRYALSITQPENGSISAEPAATTYEAGAVVTLTATPETGYRFVGWTGDATGSTNPLQLTMDADKTVSATFEALPPTMYALALNQPENGSITAEPTAASYEAGTVVTLTASAANGFRFVGWTGDASGSEPITTVTMDADKTISATFEIIPPTMHTLTLTQPDNGSIAAEPSASSYEEGSVVTLTATAVEGFRFAGWTGDATGTINPLALTMNADKTVSATFERIPTYTLSITAPSNGTITPDVAADQAGKYREGTVVTLTADPASGYRFVGWTGDASGSELTTTVTMDSDKTVSATFEAIPPAMYALTITQPGNGSITAEPAAATYVAGTVVTLTATPVSGYRFSGWTGDASGTQNPLQLTMDADKTVSATFTAIASGPQVTGFTLVNSHNEQDLFPLADGAVVVTSQLPSTKLNIRANTAPAAVGSVRLELSGAQARTYTDNAAPYALHGDDGRGNYYFGNWNPPAPGTYTLRATPFTGANGTGTPGTPLTITFTVVDQPDTPTDRYSLTVNTVGSGTVRLNPEQNMYAAGTAVTLTATPASGFRFAGWSGDASGTQNPLQLTMDTDKTVSARFEALTTQQQVTSFTLVNSHNEQDLFPLADGAVVVTSQLPSTKLNIRANTAPAAVGSVRLELSGAQARTYTDNAAPYALHGDDGRGNYYFGNWNPPAPGTYTLRATPFTGANGTGTPGTPLTITFTVVVANGAMANSTLQELRSTEVVQAAYVYPNPTSDGRVRLVAPTGEHQQLEYSLVNSIGERLYSGELTKEASSNHIDLDFSEKMKTPGVYFLKVEGTDLKRVFKIMKTL